MTCGDRCRASCGDDCHGADAHGDAHGSVSHGDDCHGACAHGSHHDTVHEPCSCSCEHCAVHCLGHRHSSRHSHHDGHGHFRCSSSSGHAHLHEGAVHGPSGSTEDAAASDPCPDCNLEKCKWAERCNRKKKCRFCHCGVDRVIQGPGKLKSKHSKGPSAANGWNSQQGVTPAAPPVYLQMASSPSDLEDPILHQEPRGTNRDYMPGLLLQMWAAAAPQEPPALRTAALVTSPDASSPLLLTAMHEHAPFKTCDACVHSELLLSDMGLRPPKH
mmetsp:Transcript_18867/g.34115  ORF Transcript_18867/g.34115 Transcript_18867/m.34115 type:complete len:273 (-) Transcript_18867:18-836(-)